MEEIGIVVGESYTNYFIFRIMEDKIVLKHDIIGIKRREGIIFARVLEISSINPILKDREGYIDARVEHIEYLTEIEMPRLFAKAEVIGYFNPRKKLFEFPREVIKPGEKVYKVDDELLENVFDIGESRNLYIGHLINRENVRVFLDINSFLRHLAIIAQTGAGKSYTAGVLIEELYKKGASILIIDSHADYVFLNRNRSGDIVIKNFTVFRNPKSIARYKIDAKNLLINVFDMDLKALCELLGIKQDWSKIIDDLRTIYMYILSKKILKNKEALKKLQKDNILAGEINNFKTMLNKNNPIPKTFVATFDLIYNRVKEHFQNSIIIYPEDFIIAFKELYGRKYQGSYQQFPNSNILTYITKLLDAKIFVENESLPTDIVHEILKPKHISVIDLSGLDDDVSNVIVWKILSDIYNYNSRQPEPYPIFIFIEEAHRFAPSNRVTRAKEIIKKIASEGRKFGICLIIITQRPSKIDQDVLSQCNSQIILRITNPQDQKAVREASETLAENLSRDLPSLNVGEAIITGPIIKLPAVVKIRKRETIEGGADIDIARKLRDSSSISQVDS